MSAQLTSEKVLTPKEPTTRDALAEAVGNVREQARGWMERTKERAVRFETDFEDYVRVHPVRTIAITAGVGLGVGILIGFLVGRR